MKFQLTGGLDVPDWLLAETAVVQRLSSVKAKLLTSELCKNLTGASPVNYDKINKYFGDDVSVSDIKAAVAAIQYIVSSAAKYACEAGVLLEELQQLGLPRETCEAITRVYHKNEDALRAQFAVETLKLPRLQDVAWRVDYVLASSHLKKVRSPTVNLALTVDLPPSVEVATAAGPSTSTAGPSGSGGGSGGGDGGSRVVAFDLDADKFRVLRAELQRAYDLMVAASAANGDEDT